MATQEWKKELVFLSSFPFDIKGPTKVSLHTHVPTTTKVLILLQVLVSPTP